MCLLPTSSTTTASPIVPSIPTSVLLASILLRTQFIAIAFDVSWFATVKAHRCVTDGTKDHRSRPFILAITVLARVLVILIVSVVLLLGKSVAVRVGCKLLLITRVKLVVIRLKGLICTFCKDQHILESTRPVHEYFLSDMCL